MSDRPTRVLVSGASIAGPAAAYWLDRVGYGVAVLERAPGPRTGGQDMDVRGRARDDVDRMGLLDAVRRAGTGEVGLRFVDESGGTVSELGADDDSDGPTVEREPVLARLGLHCAWLTIPSNLAAPARRRRPGPSARHAPHRQPPVSTGHRSVSRRHQARWDRADAVGGVAAHVRPRHGPGAARAGR